MGDVGFLPTRFPRNSSGSPREEKHAFLRQGPSGHRPPSTMTFYRGCSMGRWGVMEQQPGPVNWARFNPAPLQGHGWRHLEMWTLEAAAQGPSLPPTFPLDARRPLRAGKQMHDGLLRHRQQRGRAGARSCAPRLRRWRIIVPSGARQRPLPYGPRWVFSIGKRHGNHRYLQPAGGKASLVYPCLLVVSSQPISFLGADDGARGCPL